MDLSKNEKETFLDEKAEVIEVDFFSPKRCTFMEDYFAVLNSQNRNWFRF